jgi:hypothetical protein
LYFRLKGGWLINALNFNVLAQEKVIGVVLNRQEGLNRETPLEDEKAPPRRGFFVFGA